MCAGLRDSMAVGMLSVFVIRAWALGLGVLSGFLEGFLSGILSGFLEGVP